MVEVIDLSEDSPPPSKRQRSGEQDKNSARLERVRAILPTAEHDAILRALGRCKMMPDDAAVQWAVGELLLPANSRQAPLLTDAELAARLAAEDQRELASSDRELARRLAGQERHGSGAGEDGRGKDLVAIEGEQTGATHGVLEALHQRLISEAAATPDYEAFVCSDTVLYSSVRGDKGWSCGYRNAQMMLSHLLARGDRAHGRLVYRERLNSGTGVIPSLRGLQALIEDAWGKGFDAVGAGQLQHKVLGTRKWIGATEVATLFRAQGVRAQIVDFSSLEPPHGRDLFSWVRSYFSASRLRDEGRHGSFSGHGASRAGKVNFSTAAPLYLQHQGHSRLIVGVCRKHNVEELLILDPGADGPALLASLSSGRDWERKIKRPLESFKANQHQVLRRWGRG
jgi:hypothetical protein